MYETGNEAEFGRTAAFIDLAAIGANTRAVKRLLGGSTLLMAVVKADGYGHGAVAAATAAAGAGADYFGVATAEEGLELFESGITGRTLALGFIERGLIRQSVSNGLEFTVFEYETARLLSGAAVALQKPAGVHLKIDTGMGRLGFMPGRAALETIGEIAKLPGIDVRGAFSHLADSDGDPEFTARQLADFNAFCAEIERAGVPLPLRHIANSGAIIANECAGLNMARAGIVLYGLTPSSQPPPGGLALTPALSWKSRLSFVKTLPAGSTVSYGRTYTLPRGTLIGTVPVGYADGYARANGNAARVIVNGAYAPVVGRVCMDQFMVDLSAAPRSKIGDEVLLIGSAGGLSVTADDLARNAGTINYEVVCGISKRVKRIYTNTN